MDHTPQSADEIRRQMQITRRRVRSDVGEVLDGARQLADWRYYPRRYPWVTLGVAAALGYAVMPKRAKSLTTDAGKALEESMRRHQELLDSGPTTARERGLIGALAVTAGGALLRWAVGYAGQEFSRRLQSSGRLVQDSSGRLVQEPPA